MKDCDKLLILIIIIFLFSCNSNELTKEDAERSLKVLNSDLVNFGTSLTESSDYKIIKWLINQPNAPFPFQKNLNGFIRVKDFDFNKIKGEYFWNEEQKTFQKNGESEQITMHFSEKEFEDLTFIITSYKSEIISSKENFPIQFNAEIQKKDKKIWDMVYHSKISDKLPESIYLKVDCQDYDLLADLNRTKDGENGTLDFSFTFDYLLKRLIETQFRSTIGYSRQGYFFNKIKIEQKVFNHILSGYLDYDLVNPTVENYPASFNDNSSFELFEKNKGKVGNVVLTRVENNELFDFHIKFTNGDEELLTFYIPLIDKLLNFKY